MSAVKERLELSKKKLATATTSEGSLKQETDRQSADVRDIEIQLADIAKSERMLEGMRGPARPIVPSSGLTWGGSGRGGAQTLSRRARARPAST